MRSKCALLWLVCLASLPLAHAQFSGRVTGTVVDASGGAVPNADVNLSLPGSSKPLLSTKTTSEGLYHFIAVRPAYYDVSVEAPGFVKANVRGISVDPARETAVPDIKLQLPSVAAS